MLAALRERMLRLAAEKADGVFANFLPLGNVEQVVRTFDRPEKELACRLFSIHGPEEEALAQAKRTFVAYATVPVYADFFRWLGRGDEIDPVVEAWSAGDRKRALEARTRRLSSARSSCSARSKHSASALRRSPRPASTPPSSQSPARLRSCRT